MWIIENIYSGPGIIHAFEVLPHDAKAALRDLKVGETAIILGPDNHEYRLTLVSHREFNDEQFDPRRWRHSVAFA
jgi:hypothetical protein